MTRHTKNVVIFSVIFFFFVVVPHVSAEGFTALAPIPGLTDAATVNTASGLGENTLANFFNNLYKYLIGLAAVIAIIEIIIGGLEISTKDSVSKNSLGKERIYNALFGLVLVLSPVLVFSIINPSILNLSLNLPKLNETPTTSSSAPAGTSTTPPPANPALTAAIAAGCTVRVPNKTVSCANRSAAQTFADACPNNSGSISQVPYPNWEATCATALQSACVTSGVLLKTALCASDVEAQGWLDSSCSFRVGGVECGLMDSSRACVRASAVCGAISKEFMFLDKSYQYNPSQTFSNYQPLASTPSNSSNGAEAVQFITQCTQDGGVSCLTEKSIFADECKGYYTTLQPANQSNKCYLAKLTCAPKGVLNTLQTYCTGSPSYTPIR
jgi:hypothetical protein